MLVGRVNLITRLRLAIGVVRRWWMHCFHKEYIKSQIEKRKGECKHCGVCCQLTFKCPALRWTSDGKSQCNRYQKYRFPNCCTYPIDERDIRDRNLISPQTKCGYYWDE